MGLCPKTEGASGKETNLTTRDGTSPELQFPMPHQGKSLRINRYRVWAIMSKYQPTSKPELHRPQAPSVTCGDSSLPEGAIGGCVIWRMVFFNVEITCTLDKLKLRKRGISPGFGLFLVFAWFLNFCFVVHPLTSR